MMENPDQQEAVAPEVETVYVDPPRERFACGDEFVRERIEQHPKFCAPCRVIEGKSRATVGDQSFVSALFCAGIDGSRSKSGNLRSGSAGIMTHYQTISAVRLRDETTVIRNVQDFGSGFAKAPNVRTDINLPLNTVANVIEATWSSDRLRDIKVIDRTDNEVLFAHEKRTFLFGHDNFHPYLVELKDRVGTVYEALLSMAPPAVIEANDVPVLRQGEFWFIRQEPTVQEREYVSVRAHIKKNAVSRFEPRLVRPEIEKGSAHTAGEVLVTDQHTFVRGTIRHARREHAPVVLGDTWHLALRNTNVLASYRVERRGIGGGRD